MADSITLKGKEIPYKDCVLLNVDLQYYPENPRIYSIVCTGNGDPSQDEIEERLSSMDHVKQLIQSIKANGGLTDPLLVRDGDFLVLEGNSRLAAYRILSKVDPIKWGKIKCRLLPSDMGEDLIFALLGEYHIIGRKDWSPYEQAGYVWRRVKKHNINPDKMASEMGLSSKNIKHLINVYQFMIDNNDTDVQRWSYYDEYLKSTKIAKRRQEYPEFDKVIVEKIKKGEIEKAVDVRDKVKKIAEIGGKTLKKFITTPNSLDTCMDRAISRGADNVIYKRLNAFRTQIYDPDLKNDFKIMPENQLNKCKFELEKIKSRIDRLIKALDD